MRDSNARLSQYWSRSLESLLAALNSTPDGLSVANARQRLEQFAGTRGRDLPSEEEMNYLSERV